MAGFFSGIRERMAAQPQQPTASPATPPGMAPTAAPAAPGAPSTFGGWNADNAFSDWDPQQLSTQTGMSTDDLRTGRSAYQQEMEQKYRQAMGARGQQADATSANLFNSPDFLSFAKTGQLAPQQPQGGGQTLASLGGADQQYGFGSAIAPWTQQFNAPTAQEAIGTPGLQYALGRAQQAIERSAASKGTLLTGGTLRDLSENQIGMALQGYQGAYNNKRSEFDLGRSIFNDNQDRPFDKYYKLGELGRPV